MEILDNINKLWGDDLKNNLKPRAKLKIAASFFSIYAYEALKKELSSIESLEFIFTKPTFTTKEATEKHSKERREFFIPKQQREKGLYGSEFEIHLKNKLTQKAIAQECAAWIKEKARFKTNTTKSSMQNFACIDNSDSAVAYMPLDGFTAVDLGYQNSDAVSKFVNKMDDSPSTTEYLELFKLIWNDKNKLEDVTENICTHIESVYQENSPEKIYFLMLYNIFNEFLENLDEDCLPNDLTGYQDSVVWNKLFNFQRDAATGIINKLEKYSGCILADSVGLGKTFSALAVIKYYELKNRAVLVLCPKKLSDNWLTYNRNLTTNILAEDRLRYDVLCHTDLLRDSGESFGTKLAEINWGNYDLVVIDESHNFRNNDTFKDKETRYQRLLNTVIREGVKTKVLMLSATPVNNKFNDLKNQLLLAYEDDFETLSKKLNITKNVDDIFRNAQSAFNNWSKLLPEERTAKNILNALSFDFFELLDSVTIARSRKHIETFYDTSEIGKFPIRNKPISLRAPLTDRTDVMDFNKIYKNLSLLKLAVYAPVSYILPSRIKKYEEIYDTKIEGGRGNLKQVDRERSLQALMVTNLLKRLESSVEAFRLTLTTLQNNHNAILNKITEYRESGVEFSINEANSSWSEYEEDDDLGGISEFMTTGKVQVSLSDMDLVSWEFDLNKDLNLIETLLASMLKIVPKDDKKLEILKNQVKNKIENPINLNNKKVLIFTAFADTANYLYTNLAPMLKELGIYTAKVTGSSSPKSTLNKNYGFGEILTLFSPISKSKDLILPNETREIDVIIATDCISEGQNLQDCDYLINYDIHWNPVRIIQRFGRIDRIGSPNDCIQLVNYWPDISLDDYINLKERVENRMIIVDVTATGDDNVLSSKANDLSYRKEQLRKLQDEVVEMEDLKTGVNITDLGLNDFRMDLLAYIKAEGDLADSPNGLHAIIPANIEAGLAPGVIFTLRNRNASVNINNTNRLHPYYLVYLDKNGFVISDHTEVKKLLDLVRGNCKGLNAPIANLCQVFNAETEDGRNMSEYSKLLSQAIESIIDTKSEKDIDSLFSSPKTSALVNEISGLDDFELISFLVIKEGNT